MTSTRRAHAGYYVALAGAAIMFAGGIADQLVSGLLPPHEDFLGVTRGGAPERTVTLLLLLLHTLGAALVALSVAIVALLVLWMRTGLRWPAVVATVVAVFAEGMNAFAIYRVGSPLFWGPLTAVLLVGGGVALALLTPQDITERA